MPAVSDLLPLTEYRTAVARAVVSLDVHAEGDAPFVGRLDAVEAGDIHLLDLRASAHSVNRTPALIERSTEAYFKFTLVEHGTAMIVQDGRETTLSAGDMVFYDTARPYSLLCHDDIRLSLLMFPRNLLALPPEVASRLTATRLDGRSGVGGVIRPYVKSLTQQIDGVDARTARRLARSAIDMVGTLVEASLSSVPEATAAASHRDVMRRILDYIDEHLSDPELSPAGIAAAHFISLRHLHGLFSEIGSTVSTVVRTRRLERCYDELVHPLHAHRSVTSIAQSNGFLDAAHFSRLFRAHFGVPPSVARRREP
ncbi:helix-turn-helix domain-containing protein [Plantibacter flavus]|uniref:AraC-like ligand-binding domain-containing protein n=1 Tax=Plantibacter flavus TaxID=150123 RepID=UPI003F18ED23